MSDPPRGPKPANATIEIDRSELEVILGSTPPPPHPQGSFPPPLPAEEIARAQSMAPAQPMIGAPVAPGVAPAHARPSLVPYIVISVALMVFAGIAATAVLYLNRARTDAATPIASTSAAVVESPASASPSSAPAGTTLTIHTVELGGKSGE